MRPANSPCAPEFGCSDTAANPVMRQSACSSSAKICEYPSAWSRGTNGCSRENSGHVIGSISAAAFSFIVHEPSGIIEVSRPTSLRSSRRMYRIILVSE